MRQVKRNVKRWPGGSMVVRVAAWIREAAKGPSPGFAGCFSLWAHSVRDTELRLNNDTSQQVALSSTESPRSFNSLREIPQRPAGNGKL